MEFKGSPRGEAYVLLSKAEKEEMWKCVFPQKADVPVNDPRIPYAFYVGK